MENQEGREVICCMPYCNVIKTKGLDGPSTARAKSIKESIQHVVLRHVGVILEGYIAADNTDINFLLENAGDINVYY